MSLIVGVGDFGIADLVSQAQVARDAAQAAKTLAEQAATSIQEGADLGPWNPVTNTPTLTANATAIAIGGYYNVTVAGAAPFAGANFTQGSALAVGDRIAKVGAQWYRRAFTITAGAEIASAGSSQTAIMNRAAVKAEIQGSLRLFPLSKNLFNRNSPNIQQNVAVDATSNSGNIGPATNYWLSDYIPVLPGETYTFSNVGGLKAVRYENAARANLGGGLLSSTSPTVVTIPTGGVWLVFTCKSSAESTIPVSFQVEKGNTANAYEAYDVAIDQINGSPVAASRLKSEAKISTVGGTPDAVMNLAATVALIPVVNKQLFSRNLFNRLDSGILNNKFIALDTSGILGDGANYQVSYPVAVLANTQYTFSGVGVNKAVRYENASRVNLGGQPLGTTNTTITTPASCAFIVFTVKSSSDTGIPSGFQVELGSVANSYEPYQLLVDSIGGAGLVAESMKDNARIGNSGADLTSVMNRGAVLQTLPQLSKNILSRNLFNRADSGIGIDKLVSIDTSGIIASPLAGYWISAPIAVTASTQYTFSGVGINKAVSFQDANKSVISGQVLPNNATTTVTTPANCVFVVFTCKGSTEAVVPTSFQFERGSVATAYQAYQESYNAINGVTITAGALVPNSTIETSGPGMDAVMNRAAVILQQPPLTKTLGKNLFNRATIQLDKFIGYDTSGLIYTLANYQTSVPVAVLPATQYTFSGIGVNKAVRYEDVNHGNLGGQILPSNVNTTITTPANCYFVVFTVKWGSSDATIPASFQFERSSAATSYESYQSAVTAIDGVPLSASSVANGVKLTTPGTTTDSIPNRQSVIDLLPSVTTNRKNLFNRNATDFQVDKLISLDTNGTIAGPLTGYRISGPIAVLPGTAYTFSGVTVNKAVRFEDVNHTSLGGQVLPNETITTVTTPANCYFVVFTIKASADADIPVNFQFERGTWRSPIYVPYFEQLTGINGQGLPPYHHPSLTGKKFLILGDSIACVKPQTGGTQIEWPTFIDKPYWGDVYHAAQNGARIKDDPGESNRVILSNQIQYAIDQNWIPDVIGLFIGTNDYFTVNTGTYAAAMAKTLITDLDRTILYEALRYAYWKITLQWPNATVFHATPIQRPDRTLETAKTVSDAIKLMAPNYCVRVIDAEAESGIVRQFENTSASGRYLRDGLHPNDTGKPFLADYYMKRIIRSLV